MSIISEFKNLNFRDRYLNLLFILIMPLFVIGQFYFKLVLIIIIFSGIYIFKYKILNIKKNFINIFFLILIIYFLINAILISPHYYYFNLRFLTFIGIILFFLVTNYLIVNDILNLKLIFKTYALFFCFILFDTLYQIIYLKDLFGYDYLFGYSRFAGPFGDEFILGAFMSFFLMPAIILSYKNDVNLQTKICFLFFFYFSIYIALKTGERIALLTILLQISLFLLIFKFNIKLIFAGIFSLIIIFLTIIFDHNVRDKYQHFYRLIFDYQKNFINTDNLNNEAKEQKNINSISFLNTQSGAHFLTAYEIWKNYPILGIGIKNFRNESSKEKYANIKSHQVDFRSATHPHNYQLELLSETGLVGIILFNIFMISLIYNFFIKYREKNKDIIYLNVFMIIIISKYFPLKTDSSLFSSSLGALFWIFLIYSIASYNKSIKY